MNIFRRTKPDATDRELAELRRRESAIKRERRKAESKARKTKTKGRAPVGTIPPPDDLPDRERECKFFAELESRGQVRNEIRAQTGNVFMLLVLIVAFAAVIWWGVRMLHGV